MISYDIYIAIVETIAALSAVISLLMVLFDHRK